MTLLLDAVDANTNGGGVNTDGGSRTVVIWATDYDGGTVTLQASPDDGTTWITLTVDGSPATFTANAVRVIDYLGQGLQMRATLTGATNPVAVSVGIYQ